MNIIKLEKNIVGKGEMVGFRFERYAENDSGYIYRAIFTELDFISHYEVFLKKVSALCIDFEKRIYSEREFKEIYPKSENFGDWAWCINDVDKAMIKFNSLQLYNQKTPIKK